jgi:hypothetical protein
VGEKSGKTLVDEVKKKKGGIARRGSSPIQSTTVIPPDTSNASVVPINACSNRVFHPWPKVDVFSLDFIRGTNRSEWATSFSH